MNTQWKKSSRSAQNGQCVEVAELAGDLIGVRDSKDNLPGCPILTFPGTEWNLFLSGVMAGEFDLRPDASA
jgi:Domain of unknown function (DUF397)